MSINRLNYEEYLADYLEGSLDPVLSAELMVFLSENPDLEKQFLETEPGSHSLQAEVFHCPFKEGLKKDFADVASIHEQNFNEFCIADLEGLLKEEDKKRLLDYLDLHPQQVADYEAFQKTLLRPDPNLRFYGKERLKKTVSLPSRYRFPVYLIRIAAIAAVVLLVLLLNPGKKSVPADPIAMDWASTASPDVPDKHNNTEPAQEAVLKPRPAAVMEKKSCPVSEEDETAFAPSLLNAIPSALLPDPNPEVTPVERALIIPSPIPETSGLMASGTGAKKPGKDIPDLRTLVQKVDVLKTAERVVDGVNYLTESRIQLYSVVNDQGKLTELVIHSEAFRLESRRNN